MVKPMPYAEMFPPEEEYHLTVVSRTMFINSFDQSAAETMVEHLHASDALIHVVQLRVPVEATVFTHRQSAIMVNVAAFF